MQVWELWDLDYSAAIEQKIANPRQDVICIRWRFNIQMNIQELGTIPQYELAIQILVINNGWQGMHDNGKNHFMVIDFPIHI